MYLTRLATMLFLIAAAAANAAHNYSITAQGGFAYANYGSSDSFTQFFVSEVSQNGNPPPGSSRGTSAFANLSQCAISSDRVIMTCLSASGSVPAAMLSVGVKSAAFAGDLAKIPDFSLFMYSLNVLTGDFTQLSPPSSVPVSLQWTVNGFFSNTVTGTQRTVFFGTVTTRVGPSTSDSASVQGYVGSQTATFGDGGIGRMQNVTITIQH
jgi:hypothetical protein